METLTTEALIIKPKDSVFIKDISIDKKDSFEVKTTWTVSSVCNSERRRFNLTKSHTDSNAFVGGHEAVGVIDGEHYLEKSYALLPHSNCLTRNEKIKCPACHNNSENLCGHMRHAGLDENTPSGFVKQMFVPKSQLYDVSEIDLEIAPFLEPLSCVIRSWEKISFDYTSGVNEINIVGGGPIGCLHALYVNKINKKNKINIIEKNVVRRSVLKNIFMDVKNIRIIDGDSETLSDVSVMAASDNDAYKTTVSLTKKEGTIILFSGFDDLSFIDNNFLPEIIHRNEFIHYTSNFVFVGSSGYAKQDILKAKMHLLDFHILKKLVTGKVYGLNSNIINMYDGTTEAYEEPVLIKDIKGHYPQHIKIQYFNNYDDNDIHI